MFVLFATKPLNDRTTGARFNVFGIKGLYRKRKALRRGFKINKGKSMTAVHVGKRTVYLERKANKISIKALHHFAG